MEGNIKICPKCGTENEDSSIECRNCGIIFDKYEKLRKELFTKAQTALQENELHAAKNMFEQLSADYPELAEKSNKYLKKIYETIRDGIFSDALANYKENKLDSAETLFEQLSADYPEMAVEANMYLKKIHESQGDDLFKKAISYFESGLPLSAEPMFKQIVSDYPKKAEEANVYLKKMKESRDNWPIGALGIVAWTNLIAGFIGAIIILTTIGTKQTFGGFAAFLGLMAILWGVSGWAFLLVVCSMAKNLIQIRENTIKRNEIAPKG